MIPITANIAIDESEIQEEFVRSSGPGGQNVNKVASAVQLRFDVVNSATLPADVRRRLLQLAGNRVSKEGILTVTTSRHRSQRRNRQDALDQLVALIRQAAQKPKPRRKTKPTAASKRRRLEKKRQRSEIKRNRRPIRRWDDG